MRDRFGLGRGGAGVRRRSVVAAAAAAALMGVGACSVPAPRRSDTMADPAPGMVIGDARQSLLMQILAHPDDDLYFMNPDTQQALDAGTPVVCVYLTAGEAVGINRIPGAPRPAADKAAYSSARHQGLRRSYAIQLRAADVHRLAKSVIAAKLTGSGPRSTP